MLSHWNLTLDVLCAIRNQTLRNRAMNMDPKPRRARTNIEGKNPTAVVIVFTAHILRAITTGIIGIEHARSRNSSLPLLRPFISFRTGRKEWAGFSLFLLQMSMSLCTPYQ